MLFLAAAVQDLEGLNCHTARLLCGEASRSSLGSGESNMGQGGAPDLVG